MKDRLDPNITAEAAGDDLVMGVAALTLLPTNRHRHLPPRQQQKRPLFNQAAQFQARERMENTVVIIKNMSDA